MTVKVESDLKPEQTTTTNFQNPENLDTRKKCCKYPEIGRVSFYYRVMGLKDADGIANSVNPDQTAPLNTLGAV